MINAVLKPLNVRLKCMNANLLFGRNFGHYRSGVGTQQCMVMINANPIKMLAKL